MTCGIAFTNDYQALFKFFITTSWLSYQIVLASEGILIK